MRLAALVFLLGALCFSSDAYAEGQRLWSRMISSEPANSADRAREFVLYGIDQGERHLVGTWSYTNGAVGNKTPPRVVIEGTKTADGAFWLDVKLEARKGRTGKWKRIEKSPNEGERATVIIEPNAVNFDLSVNLDALKPLIPTYDSGRIVLKTGRTSEFELKDLLPPGQQVQDRSPSTETAGAQLEHIQGLLGARFLKETAQPKPEEEALVQQIDTRARPGSVLISPPQIAEKQTTSSKGPDGSFLLLSWKNTGTDYQFALIPLEKEEQFLRNFQSRRRGLQGLDQLKAALEQLPPGTPIVWEDDQIKGLTYPPISYIGQVTSFVRSKGLRIELNPVIVE